MKGRLLADRIDFVAFPAYTHTQRGDWESVLALGREALGKGLTPGDSIEWIPFLQAYAHAGDVEKLTGLAADLTSNPFIGGQACRVLRAMTDLPDPVIPVIDSLYCTEEYRTAKRGNSLPGKARPTI